MPIKVWPGTPYPLGATWTGQRASTSPSSARTATGVDICLFDNADTPTESVRVRMTEQTDSGVARLPARDQTRPALRLPGLRTVRIPEKGLRFNASKLLLDPYSKAISGDINWGTEMYGYEMGAEGDDHARDYRDDAWGMPKSIVVDPAFDWGNDARR